MTDQAREPKRRKGVAAPPEYGFIVLAERFGRDPLTWPRRGEVAAVLRFLNLIGAAGQAQADTDRYGPDSIQLGE